MKKTIYDDGFIDDEGIEEIRKGIPEISFKQEYLCEFLDDSLSFFQGYSDCFDITSMMTVRDVGLALTYLETVLTLPYLPR